MHHPVLQHLFKTLSPDVQNQQMDTGTDYPTGMTAAPTNSRLFVCLLLPFSNQITDQIINQLRNFSQSCQITAE